MNNQSIIEKDLSIEKESTPNAITEIIDIRGCIFLLRANKVEFCKMVRYDSFAWQLI
jgi:hypothetical protein